MSSIPSHVRIVVRTRPTDFIADDLSILPDGTLHISRRVTAAAGAAQPGHTKHGATSGAGGGGGGGGGGGAGDGNISSLASETAGASYQEKLSFNFDAILHNASQEAVYEATTADLVESVLQGLNCTLLCYGQSGSGKTYTLFGGNTYPTRGCVPRAVQSMFEYMAGSTDHEFRVSLTFVEVYGDQLFDLLGKGPTAPVRPGGKDKATKKVVVTLDGNGDVLLRGVEERQCAGEAEALAAVFEGMQRRMSRVNSLSPQSPHSHTVLTFHVLSKSLVDSDALVHHSRCTFVDLAGIQRPTSLADEAARQGAKIINRSIMMFEQVILALSGPQPRHVPYRQSKLTMLLKDSIGGTSRTTLIANIWPEERHKELTFATLTFAKRLVRIESHPAVNASLDPEAHIKMLQRQVTSLKSELRMQDQLAGREAVSTAPLDADEMQTARERVMAFVSGATPQVRVGCVREMHACFMVFKTLLAEREAQLRDAEGQRELSPYPVSSASAKGSRRKEGLKQQSVSEAKEHNRYVNSVEDTAAGVSLGTIDRLSPVIRDVFFQRQRTFSNAGQALLTGARERGTDGYTAGAMPTPKATTNSTASNNAAAAEGVGLSFTTVGSTTRANAAALPTPEGELMRMPAHPTRPSSSSVVEKGQTNLPPLERENTTASVSFSRILGRQDNVLRDRRTAFEAYKLTNGGVCQLEAIGNARKLVVEKKEAIAQLQKRLNEIKMNMEGDKSCELPHTATMEERVMARNPSVDGAHSSFLLFEGTHSVNENNGTGSDSTPATPTEKLPHMTLEDRKALLNLTNAALTRAMMERGVLERRFNRLCDALMSNFQYWHQSQLQSLSPVQGERATTATTGDLERTSSLKGTISFNSGIPRAMAQGESDTRFMETTERLEALEMQRLEQQVPEGAAFYAAQRIARRGLQSRE